MCCVRDKSEGLNLSHESLTSTATKQKLEKLIDTHPTLYSKLTSSHGDTIPDPGSQTKRAPRGRKQTKAAARSEAKACQKAAMELEEDANEEEGDHDEDDSPFDSQAEFEDDIDVPVDVVVEHVISEGNDTVDGLVIQQDGRLSRSEDIEAELCEDDKGDKAGGNEAVPENESSHVTTTLAVAEGGLRRGKRVKIDNRWYAKDWMMLSEEIPVPASPPKPRKPRCTRNRVVKSDNDSEYEL
jgi:hypothetical protein